MKRRTEITKLITQARNIWRQSQVYREVKQAAKVKPGWYKCAQCGNLVEVIRIDHIKPIGTQPKEFKDFSKWLTKLFCDKNNLRAICNTCHKEKTKQERKR